MSPRIATAVRAFSLRFSAHNNPLPCPAKCSDRRRKIRDKVALAENCLLSALSVQEAPDSTVQCSEVKSGDFGTLNADLYCGFVNLTTASDKLTAAKELLVLQADASFCPMFKKSQRKKFNWRKKHGDG